jgi:hypothetical protein
MREDMFKVIVERPRGGQGCAHSSRKRLNRDGDLPTKIGVRRHMWITGAKSKWLKENLAPLKRYLGRQVGRRWDDIYSEIAATLGARGTVQQHVLLHLDDFVARHVAIDGEGRWRCYDKPHWAGESLPWRQRYYLDPRDGVLRDSHDLWRSLGIDPRPWRRRAPKPDPNLRRLDDMRELRRIEGNWYEVVYDKDPEALRWVFDLVERREVPARNRHAISKRQLSGPELKTFGLANKQPI